MLVLGGHAKRATLVGGLKLVSVSLAAGVDEALAYARFSVKPVARKGSAALADLLLLLTNL